MRISKIYPKSNNININHIKQNELSKNKNSQKINQTPLALKVFLDSTAIANKSLITFTGKVNPDFPKAVDFKESLDKYYRFTPDKYQKEAAEAIYHGNDSIVTAPTGTGKTLIGEYAIRKNLAEGKRTFYTTPLKALSNQKYNDFCKLYGSDNVGLSTGDTSINPDAKVVVMTTEIYRNMLFSDNLKKAENIKNQLGTVIYDEFHYMNDPERGKTWEESIMFTPQGVQTVALSATVENDNAITDWIGRLNLGKSQETQTELKEARLTHVNPNERHVPLKYYFIDPHKPNTLHALTDDTISISKLLNPEVVSEKQENVLSEIAQKSKQIELLENGMNDIKSLYENVNSKNLSNEALTQFKKAKKDNYYDSAYKIIKNVQANHGKTKIVSESIKILQSYNSGSKSISTAIKLLEDMQNTQKELEFADLCIGNLKRVKSSKISDDTLKKVYNSINELKQYSVDNTLADITLEILNNVKAVSKENHEYYEGIQVLKNISNKDNIIPEKLANLLQKQLLSYTDAQRASLILIDKDKTQLNKNLPKHHIEKPENDRNKNDFEDKKNPMIDVISTLKDAEKLPAIFFVLSRKGCEKTINDYMGTGNTLLNKEEEKQAEKIIEIFEKTGTYFGANFNKEALLRGVAPHHAGMMPAYKMLVETLFQKKLVKVVVATETLAAGINMPAKTTVMTQLERGVGLDSNGKTIVEPINSSDFQQMAGRAGRRGIDPIGNVVIVKQKKDSAKLAFDMAMSSPQPIQSNFRPSYSFLTHFITLNKNVSDIDKAVDKSFIKEEFKARGDNPTEYIKNIKKQFHNLSKVILNPNFELFKGLETNLKPTIKGQVVSRVRGENELLITEALYKGGLHMLSPVELASTLSFLTDCKELKPPKDNDEFAEEKKPVIPEEIKGFLDKIQTLNTDIQNIEQKENYRGEVFKPNIFAVEFISEWAKYESEDSLSLEEKWQELIEGIQFKSNNQFDEGDFMRTINLTTDLLKQVATLSEFVANKTLEDGYDKKLIEKMQTIHNNAEEAVEMLKKYPVTNELPKIEE